MTDPAGWERTSSFTAVCPECGKRDRYPMDRLGQEVSCRYCLFRFPAVPDLDNGDELAIGISIPAEALSETRRDEPGEDDSNEDAPRRRRPADDGSGLAVAALVLGVFNLAFWCCPPVGVLTGAAGVALGFAGLASRSRSAALVGMVLSLFGLLLSVGFGVLVGVIMVQEEELKDDPSGNRPPFFHAPD